MERTYDEMIDRYVYAVVRRLGSEQREDVSLELRSLIEEMVRGRQDQEEPVRSILLEMGDPSDLADRYRGVERHLIGPRYYDFYLLVLRIVGFAVSLGIMIALGISFVINPLGSLGEALSSVLGTLVSAYAQAFAWITVTFVIMERVQQHRGDTENPFSWDLDDLPEIPSRSMIIPKSEPIVSLIFLTLFFAVLNALPWLLRFAEPIRTIIVNPFLPEVFQHTIWLFNTTIVIAMCIEFAKLYSGVQTRRLAVLTVGLKLLSLIISLYIVLGSGIWNPDFVSQLELAMHTEFKADSMIPRLWDAVPVILAVLMVLGYVVETIQTLWRAWGLHFPRKLGEI